jgi:putative transposase
MSEAKRRTYTAAFKAKVGLEAIRGVKTVNEIGQEHGVHPAQVGQWKREIQEQAQSLFEKKRGPKAVEGPGDTERLYSEIGRLKVELDWLKKKVRTEPVSVRREWIEREALEQPLAVSRQCELAGVTRSWVYAPRREEVLDELDLELLGLIDAEYTRRPFYGTRRMVIALAKQGHTVNRKRVQRLMRVLGLVGMAPGPATSRPHPEHKIYPYLLRGMEIVRPNQVWSSDITYIRLEHGFAYLVAVVDWYSRRVLSWRVSNTLEAGFCVDCLEEALRGHGKPEIFNTDQGSQFTSEAFTGVLLEAGIAISMDGRGRALDNIFVERLWRSVKHEDIYLKGYATLPELLLGLTEYFAFYNGERPHQGLSNRTPDAVYRSAEGGGARIVDRFDSAAPRCCI